MKKSILSLLFIFVNFFTVFANPIDPPRDSKKFVVYLIVPEHKKVYTERIFLLNGDSTLSENYDFQIKQDDFLEDNYPIFEIYYGKIKMGTIYGDASKYFFVYLFPILEESSRDRSIRKTM
jgi:hypothetical protein